MSRENNSESHHHWEPIGQIQTDRIKTSLLSLPSRMSSRLMLNLPNTEALLQLAGIRQVSITLDHKEPIPCGNIAGINPDGSAVAGKSDTKSDHTFSQYQANDQALVFQARWYQTALKLNKAQLELSSYQHAGNTYGNETAWAETLNSTITDLIVKAGIENLIPKKLTDLDLGSIATNSLTTTDLLHTDTSLLTDATFHLLHSSVYWLLHTYIAGPEAPGQGMRYSIIPNIQPLRLSYLWFKAKTSQIIKPATQLRT